MLLSMCAFAVLLGLYTNAEVKGSVAKNLMRPTNTGGSKPLHSVWIPLTNMMQG
jgi:hypothetical protein